MKIAIAAPTTLPKTIGGQEAVVHSLCKAYKDLGHEPVLITRLRQCIAQRNAAYGYRCLPLFPKPRNPFKRYGGVGPRWPVSACATLYQLKEKFDIWHVHTVLPMGWLLEPSLRRLGVPMVVTAHGADILTHRESGYGFLLDKKERKKADDMARADCNFIAISSGMERSLLGLNVHPEMITSIPNGTDIDRIRARIVDKKRVRSEYSIPNDIPLLITVSVSKPLKGHALIPAAVKRLKELGQPVHWVIVGSNPQELNRLALKHDVRDSITALPRIDPKADTENTIHMPPNAVVDLLKCADIFVLPSYSESFGLVIVEAMAAGTAVVSTRTDGADELIKDGENGLLCAIGDIDEMTDKIVQILDDSALRNQLQTSAHRSVLRFEWGKVAEQYVCLFSNIVYPGTA